MIYMMEKAFTQKMQEAATKGDGDAFDKYQKQLKWLHEYKLNKYKN